jgi:hypothetical protein
MPISFDLEFIRKEHNCDIYFETGLYDVNNTSVSIYKALDAQFKKVYSIEIREDFIQRAQEKFHTEIEKGRLCLIHDDSVNLFKHLNSPDFQNKTLFFLDAHVDNSQIRDYTLRCPIFKELDAIQQLTRKDHLILIDDLRLLRQSAPWNERSYGRINFIEKIKEHILAINPSYRFQTLDGHIKDDVLMAYVALS